MTKRAVAKALVDDGKFETQKEAEDAIVSVLDGIAAFTDAGNHLTINGFGRFEKRTRKGRVGKLNGAPVDIPAKHQLYFKDNRA